MSSHSRLDNAAYVPPAGIQHVHHTPRQSHLNGKMTDARSAHGEGHTMRYRSHSTVTSLSAEGSSIRQFRIFPSQWSGSTARFFSRKVWTIGQIGQGSLWQGTRVAYTQHTIDRVVYRLSTSRDRTGSSKQASPHPLSSSCSRRTLGHAPLVERWCLSSVQQQPCRLRQPAAVRASVNPSDDPILSKALQEPVAFLGGLFAGLLRLDLSEDPLKEWVSRTAEAAGVDLQESKEEEEDGPVEITIE